MTTILAIKDKNTVYIGSDTQATSGSIAKDIGFSKVFENGPVYIGFSGTLRSPQVLMHGESFRPTAKSANEVAWQFCEYARKILKDHKSVHKDKEEERIGGDSVFLLAFKFENKPYLYRIDTNFSYFNSGDGIVTLGSGSNMAQAAAYTALKLKKSTKEAVKLGLEASCNFDVYSSAPINIVSLTNKQNIKYYDSKNTKKDDPGREGNVSPDK